MKTNLKIKKIEGKTFIQGQTTYLKELEKNKHIIELKNEEIQDYVIFDIETTGFDFEVDNITEIGAVKYRNRKEVDRMQCFVKLLDNSLEVNEVTPHITKEILDSKGIDLKTAIEQFSQFISEDNVVLAQNSSFDWNFMSYYGLKLNNGQYIYDTIEIFKQCFISDHYALGKISEHLPIYKEAYDPNAHHAADYDSEITGIAVKEALELNTASNIIKLSETTLFFTYIDNELIKFTSLKQFHYLLGLNLKPEVINKMKSKIGIDPKISIKEFDGNTFSLLLDQRPPSEKQMVWINKPEKQTKVEEIKKILGIDNIKNEDLTMKQGSAILDLLFKKN